MTKAETNLENSRSIFFGHTTSCLCCDHFDHSAKATANLCWQGTHLFHALLDAETDYITMTTGIPIEKSSQTLRGRAREEALRAQT